METVVLNGKFTYLPDTVNDAPGSMTIDNDASNSVEWDVTFSNTALEALRASFKRVTIEVFVDDGRGFTILVPSSEIGAIVNITESMDGWSDVLTLTFVGEKYSPLLSSYIRGKRKLELWITYGSPGNEYRSSVPAFTGYFLKGVFTYYPPQAVVTCLDSALLYSEDKVNYSLQVGSKKTRLQILTELLNQGTPVPTDRVELGGDGGVIVKSVSTGTDARKFDFIRDIMSPVGGFLWFGGGKFNIVKFDPYAPVQRVLEKRDLAVPLEIDPPATNEPNVVKASSIKITSGAGDGTDCRNEVKIEEWKKVYGRQSARYIQDSSGLITPNMFPSDTPEERVTRRIITTSRYCGSTLMSSQTDEYTWFSPLIGRLRLRDAGEAGHTEDWIGWDSNPQYNEFLYEDGLWHKDYMETFQLVKRSLMHKEANLGGWIQRMVVDNYFYHFIFRGLYKVFTNLVDPPPDTIEVRQDVGIFDPFLTESGQSLQSRVQHIGLLDMGSGIRMLNGEPAMVQFMHPDSSTVNTWDINEDGSINSETQVDTAWGSGFDVSPVSVGAYHYGVLTKEYKSLPAEIFDFDRTEVITSYSQLSEDKFEIVDITTTTVPPDVTIHRTEGKGAKPFAEHISPSSGSNEMYVTLIDGTRVALSGRTQEEIQNEYCQNEAELRVVAAQELRMRSAMTIQLPMPIESQIHKGMWIAANVPEIGLTPDKKLFVWGVSRQFDRFLQTVTALYFPPEVLFL